MASRGWFLWHTQRKPTQAHGEHANSTQTVPGRGLDTESCLCKERKPRHYSGLISDDLRWNKSSCLVIDVSLLRFCRHMRTTHVTLTCWPVGDATIIVTMQDQVKKKAPETQTSCKRLLEVGITCKCPNQLAKVALIWSPWLPVVCMEVMDFSATLASYSPSCGEAVKSATLFDS